MPQVDMLTLTDLLPLRDTQHRVAVGSDSDNYVLLEINTELVQRLNSRKMFRFDGLTFTMISGGIDTIVINQTNCDVAPGTVIVTGPNDVISVDGEVDYENVRGFILLLTRDFLKGVSLDPNVVGTAYHPRPIRHVMHVGDHERAIIRHHLEILDLNSRQDRQSAYVRAIARNQVASMFYELIYVVTRMSPPEEVGTASPRRVSYTNDFMCLLSRYFRSERSIGFYAEKLCVSPKYLSLVIKDTTGKSAARWIADYVVLEAKNMLRYSGKSIQQIAYDLNFPNQSAFGKYFKHITGMSPSTFQRS